MQAVTDDTSDGGVAKQAVREENLQYKPKLGKLKKKTGGHTKQGERQKRIYKTNLNWANDCHSLPPTLISSHGYKT